MTVNWKFIPGFEESYEVSDTGEVRSCDRVSGGRKYVGKTLRPSTSKRGYKRVNLHKGGAAPRTYTVHTAVLEAFVGPRPEGLVCRHLDGDPSNNKVGNLEWGTPTENMLDKARHGTDHQRSKTECPLGHRLIEPNLQARKLLEGWRGCKACHQAQSDQYNGSSLTFKELADMRYFMVMTGRVFKFGTRRGLELEMFKKAQEWKGVDEP